MDPIATQLSAAHAALGAVSMSSASAVSDAVLLDLIARAAANERAARAHSAVLAGELVRRSAPALGHQGLSQRLGHRTPQKLLQATTGATARDAGQAVRVGGLTLHLRPRGA